MTGFESPKTFAGINCRHVLDEAGSTKARKQMYSDLTRRRVALVAFVVFGGGGGGGGGIGVGSNREGFGGGI